MNESTIEKVKLAKITRDRGINLRAGGTKQTVVDDYCEAIKGGARFPAVVAFQDSEGVLWLADGFHRAAAHEAAGKPTIEVEVRDGGRRDALLHAAGANSGHGLRRTSADKRRAVRALLADFEWAKKSDRWIAERCGVGHELVGTVRAQVDDSSTSRPRRGKDGKSYRPKRLPGGGAPKRKRRSAFERDALSVAGMAALIAKRVRRVIEQAPRAEPLDAAARDRLLQRITVGREALDALVSAVSSAKEAVP